ncbi:MAG: dihydrofolate reductase [Candidatus Kapabacteria bacterium]|nr:dihydrofolate reductase [Candidatus Kapabacteria bacterium]
MKNTVVVYIAMSFDGYIATNDDDISFLDAVAIEGEDYGYNAFMESVSTVILGNKTYQKVASMGIEFPYPMDKQVYVLSSQNKGSKKNITYWNDSLSSLLQRINNEQSDGVIFVDGGSAVVRSFLEEGFVDKIIVSIIPILLGDGKKLFQSGIPSKKLSLVQSKSFPSGLVQVEYDVEKG